MPHPKDTLRNGIVPNAQREIAYSTVGSIYLCKRVAFGFRTVIVKGVYMESTCGLDCALPRDECNEWQPNGFELR